jgi:hypothetical protein
MRTLPKDWDGAHRGLQTGIGEQLRVTYEEVLNEDIPTGHIELLQRLNAVYLKRRRRPKRSTS